MWKKLIEDGETSGKVTTSQETNFKVLEFILPKNYIIEGLTITHSAPDIGRNPQYKKTEENGKPKLTWKIINPPIGFIEYKLKVKKLSSSQD